MKYIYLIAWREYAENAKTRGFWIGLLVVATHHLWQHPNPDLVAEERHADALLRVGGPIRNARAGDRIPGWIARNNAGLRCAQRIRARTRRQIWARINSNRRRLSNLLLRGRGCLFWKIQPIFEAGHAGVQVAAPSFLRAALPSGLRKRLRWRRLWSGCVPYLRGEQRIEVEWSIGIVERGDFGSRRHRKADRAAAGTRLRSRRRMRTALSAGRQSGGYAIAGGGRAGGQWRNPPA